MSERMIDKENLIEPEAAAPVTPPPVEEAPADMPTAGDSDGDGRTEGAGTKLGEAIGKLADDFGDQINGAVDVGRLKAAAKAPGNRALDEWLGMGVNFLKGGFESALGKRGSERDE
jgi:hypothetical protein